MVRDVQFDIRADDKTRAAFASVRRNLGDTRRGFAAISAEIGANQRQLIGLGRSLGAVIGITSFAGILRSARQAIGELDDLGDAAERAGISGEKLQVLRRVLEQGAGSAADADSAMERLNKSVGELATTGEGAAKDAFAALGIEIRDANGELKSQQQIFEEVAAAFPRIKNEAQATAIAYRLFGREAGGALAVALQQGLVGLDEAEAAMRALNLIMSDESLEAADELEKRFIELSDRWDTAWKRMVLASAGAIDDINADIDRLIAALRNAGQAANSGIMGGAAGEGRAAGEVIARGRDAAPLDRVGMAFEAADAMQQDIDLHVALERSIHGVIDARVDDEDATDKAARAAEREAEKIAELISGLELELSLIGASNVEKRIANELRRAGVDAASAEGQQIAQLVTQIETETEARDRLIESLDEVRSAAAGVLSAFTSELRQSGNLVEALKASLDRVLDSILKIAEEQAILALFGARGTTGGGFLASLFGGFGGLGKAGIKALAGGGYLSAGQLALVGERGPELFVPRMAGRVVANDNFGEPAKIVFSPQIIPPPGYETRIDQADGRGTPRISFEPMAEGLASSSRARRSLGLPAQLKGRS